MFITAKVVYVNPARAELVSASAGHCPLLVWRAGEADAAAPGSAGFPLGIEPDTTYPQTVTALAAGAAALLYTDGMSEVRNANGDMLAANKLTRLFSEAAAQTRDAETGKQALLARLAAFRGEAPLADDQTFLFIRNLT
jgi:sigma-B regulation protein RsbU (phosphoserine phosphatase)